MAVSERMTAFSNKMSAGLKGGAASMLLVVLKLISGLMIGLTLTLIGQEVFKYETLLFLFVLLSVTVAFMKISKSWNFVVTLVFDLICILVALLLRMYIMIAPGG